MDDGSSKNKKYDWGLILILGIIFLLFFLVRYDFIRVIIRVIVLPAIILLLTLFHIVIPRSKTPSATMDKRMMKILLSAIGLMIFIMGAGMIKNPQTLSWVIKLLPGNVNLWKFIYENFIRGIIFILFGLLVTVAPWLTMWGARKKISAMTFPFLFFLYGVDQIFMHRDNSVSIQNLFISMSGLLFIFFGSLLMIYFRNNPKSIENFP
jgi:hypothetical protein